MKGSPEFQQDRDSQNWNDSLQRKGREKKKKKGRRCVTKREGGRGTEKSAKRCHTFPSVDMEG